MKKQYLLYCLLLISVLATSCDGFWKSIRYSREPLIYPVEDNKSNVLRTDGYYYSFKDTVLGDSCYYEVILYRNGVVYGNLCNGFCENSRESMDSSMSFDIYKRDTPGFWGAYRILHNDTIQFQKWDMDDGTDPLNIYNGLILNDTTFHLHSIKRSKEPFEETKIDELFTFRPLKVKHDSLNPFVPPQKD